MATIDSLGTSILDLSRSRLYSLVMCIRENRRTRPSATRKAPAKCARAPSAKAPKQQDLFQLATKMTPLARAKLLAELTQQMEIEE